MLNQTITVSDDAQKDFVHQDFRGSGAQTNQTLLTPSSGKQIVVTDLGGTLSSAGTVTIFYGVNTTGQRIVDLDLAGNSGPFGGIRFPFRCPPDQPVRLTTTAGNVKVVIW